MSSKSDKYMEMVYPGFKRASDYRKEVTRMMDTVVCRWVDYIDEIFPLMKDPQSPLYQEGVSDSTIVKMISRYAKMSVNNRSVEVPTGEYRRGGTYGDEPEEIYKTVFRSPEEREEIVKDCVRHYNEVNSRFRFSDLFSRAKRFMLNERDAVLVHQVIVAMENGEEPNLEDPNLNKTEIDN